MTLHAQALTLGTRLQGISVELRKGEVTAICGPNGAGKSTLLTCLAGLQVADSGSVMLDDESLNALPAIKRARAIGYLPQTPEVAWDLTVEVLVSLGRIPWHGAPQTEARQAIDAALHALDLHAYRHRSLSELSGGERARALMARVLATQPQWILADEPLANLDLAHSAALLCRFCQQAHAGRGVVLVLHDLAMAMNHADRVLVLHQGVVVTDGAPENALAENVIKSVWGIDARWLGEKGRLALAIG